MAKRRFVALLLAAVLGWSIGVAGIVVPVHRFVQSPPTAPAQYDVISVRPPIQLTAAVTAENDVASLTISRTIPRWQAYSYAIFHEKGCWYVWGGNGPCWAGYDCSGLVVAAYAHVGIYLPRTTWEMLSYWRIRFIPWSQAKAGDLVFMYGGGHVELYTGHWGWTFGAHSQGSVSSFTQWSNVYGIAHVIGAG